LDGGGGRLVRRTVEIASNPRVDRVLRGSIAVKIPLNNFR
jgi:hypothetical protein